MSDITEEGMRDQVERTLAMFFTGNRMPHMSGDPRERVPPMKRRDLSDATDSILALLQPALERARREERDPTMAVLGRNMALRSALRVNGLRSGATHADVDALLAEIDRAHPTPPSRSPEQPE